jgi:hypothetical protein
MGASPLSGGAGIVAAMPGNGARSHWRLDFGRLARADVLISVK